MRRLQAAGRCAVTPEERVKQFDERISELDERVAKLNRAAAAMRTAMTIPTDDEPEESQ